MIVCHLFFFFVCPSLIYGFLLTLWYLQSCLFIYEPGWLNELDSCRGPGWLNELDSCRRLGWLNELNSCRAGWLNELDSWIT